MRALDTGSDEGRTPSLVAAAWRAETVTAAPPWEEEDVAAESMMRGRD